MEEIKVKYFVDGIDELCYVAGKSDWIDLHAAEDVDMKAGEFRLIPLGVAIELPEGYEAHVVPRSSTFKNYGLLQANSMGVVDYTYRGDNDQWRVPMYATHRQEHPHFPVPHYEEPAPSRLYPCGAPHRSRPGRLRLHRQVRRIAMSRIVLASGSPRRQELLNRIGITDFDIRVPQTDEHYPAGLTPAQIVEYISREKADAAAKLCTPEEIVITADTMVFLDDQRLGKPLDEADALRMLTALQGRRHTVCTGVTVRQGDRVLTESEATGVVFRPAEESELRAYIATGEPMDKAGSYGVQGKGALLVERLEGDFFNVMGLPVLRLSRMLAQFGIKLL